MFLKKHLFAIAACLLFLSSNAQVTDNFSDGDFTNNPSWTGSNGDFTVNTGLELQLLAQPGILKAQLSTASKAALNASWEFVVRLDFNPSSSNLAHIYLVSDNPNPLLTSNGYMVKIGNTEDEVSLYRIDAGQEIEIIDGVNGTLNKSINKARIKVTRGANFDFALSIDTSAAFSGYQLQGNVIDSNYRSSSYFGINCSFTSTRSDKFFFDDFVVTGSSYIDTFPPFVRSFKLQNDHQLELVFSEKMDALTCLNTSNYFVDQGIGNPFLVTYDSVNLISNLFFANSFTSKVPYSLQVFALNDANGNTIERDTFNFQFIKPQLYDVIISELFPDPDPQLALPTAEFIEIYNRTAAAIDLGGWFLEDATTSRALPDTVILPGQYRVICLNSNAAQYASYGKIIPISSFPSLNNDGDDIYLKDQNGDIIDQVSYNTSWYNDNFKALGGWTLERIDLNFPCGESENWSAAIDLRGGTPGTVNSISGTVQDTIPPFIISAGYLSPDSIVLTLSENIPAQWKAARYFTVEPGIGSAAQLFFPNTKEIGLVLKAPMQLGQKYWLSIDSVADCSGNLLAITDSIFLGIPQTCAPGDIVFNEVLCYPKTGGSDYVEFYNNSSKVIDLNELYFANANEDYTIKDVVPVTSKSRLIFPGQYVVLTQEVAINRADYPYNNPEAFLELSSMPSVPSDEGRLLLLNRQSTEIDRLYYSNKYHSALIKNEQGIALERVSPLLPTLDKNNWYSAAAAVGYGTPGLKNSQFSNFNQNAGATISYEPSNKTFSPDGDGQDDFLAINYSFDLPGYVVNVFIYNRNAQLVKHLVPNELAGSTGRWIWDGAQENGDLMVSGPYVLTIQAIHPTGKVLQFKEGIVLNSLLR